MIKTLNYPQSLKEIIYLSPSPLAAIKLNPEILNILSVNDFLRIINWYCEGEAEDYWLDSTLKYIGDKLTKIKTIEETTWGEDNGQIGSIGNQRDEWDLLINNYIKPWKEGRLYIGVNKLDDVGDFWTYCLGTGLMIPYWLSSELYIFDEDLWADEFNIDDEELSRNLKYHYNEISRKTNHNIFTELSKHLYTS
jgi:hypothetical protein